MKDSIAKIHLHPSVSNPELLADLMEATGLVAVPSNRTKGIIMITQEDFLLRKAIAEIMDSGEIH